MKHQHNLQAIFSDPKLFFELLKDNPGELKKIIESKPIEVIDLNSKEFEHKIKALCEEDQRFLANYNNLIEIAYEAQQDLNAFLRNNDRQKKSHGDKRRKLNDVQYIQITNSQEEAKEVKHFSRASDPISELISSKFSDQGFEDFNQATKSISEKLKAWKNNFNHGPNYLTETRKLLENIHVIEAALSTKDHSNKIAFKLINALKPIENTLKDFDGRDKAENELLDKIRAYSIYLSIRFYPDKVFHAALKNPQKFLDNITENTENFFCNYAKYSKDHKELLEKYT